MAEAKLIPISHDSAELLFEAVERNRRDPTILADFGDMIINYPTVKATHERIGWMYDAEEPIRSGYIAVMGARDEPVGVGYLGLGRQEVERYDGSTEAFTGINISFWVNDIHRRMGIARSLATKLLADIPTLQTEHPTWRDAKLWTGIRPENHPSRALVTSLGLLSVGRRVEDPDYIVYM